jgi:methionyl-tRNA formyltransferase
MTPLRVVFAGTPAFALPPLAAVAAAHRVVGVMTQPDRPAGRGRQLQASPVKAAALAAGVPVLQPARWSGDSAALEASLAPLRALAPDVIVVVAYGLILPRALLDLPRLGCLNIHASLLPRWRGAAPIQRAILAGDAVSGVTIMQMDSGLDTGDMLRRAEVPIGSEMTGGELHDVLAQRGARLIVEALADVAAGSARPVAQPSEGVTYAAKLGKSEAAIDWSLPAACIDRQVRAFNPWPGAETRQRGEVLKLLRSRLPVPPRAAPAGMAPGTVLGLATDALEVACGEGVLQVTELQRAGRRAVSARDFHNADRAAGKSASTWGTG